MLPDTATRVQEHTARNVNQQLCREAAGNLARYADAGPEEIGRRLRDLDREWDIERTLQTNFAIVTALGLALGALVDRRWYLFSAAAAGFMVQHALQGWCPPMAVFRRAGVRTMAEIDRERYALKALRGDFQPIQQQTSGHGWDRAQAALAAVQT